MVTLVDVLGLALVASVVPAGIMIYVVWQNARKPGAVWFAVLVVGMAGWSASYGLIVFIPRDSTVPRQIGREKRS